MTTSHHHPRFADKAAFVPVPRAERLDAIDFVRGVALLGIVLVNAGSFFGPTADGIGPARLAQMPLDDQIARLLVNAFCTTKFISTFSMLFGFGLLTQCSRAEATGRSPWGFAGRRLGALAVFGLLHAVLLWWGDILFVYAMLGVFVVLFRHVQARPLLAMAWTLLACAVFFRLFSEWASIYAAEMVGMSGSGGVNPLSQGWIDAETTAYAQGPWHRALAFRVAMWLEVVATMAFVGWWFVVGQFLVGMWLYRVRFFAPEQAALRRRVLAICLPLGLALEATVAVLSYLGLKGWPWLWAVGGGVQGLSLFCLPLGYVAGLAMLANGLPRWLISPVVCAGRMALTVYLAETLIATFMAYHWGLGWFGSVGPRDQVLIALAIWAALVAFARLWLAVLPRGPMEVLWRLLEYGRA